VNKISELEKLEEQTVNLKFCLPSIVNENKISSLYFKANFSIKLQLLKRNSFVIITLNLVDQWLKNNINKIFKKGG